MWNLRAGLIGLLALSAACSASREPTVAPAPKADETAAGAPESEREGIPVQIDNQNFSDMNIYVVTGGQRLLLGPAGGLTKTTLTIPAGAARSNSRVRLVADPIGGAEPISTPLLVVPRGQSIFWTIGSDPATSTATAG
jgi:hypothetical protein